MLSKSALLHHSALTKHLLPSKRRVTLSALRFRQLCATPFPEFDDDPRFKSYQDLHRFSTEKSEEFWDILAKSRLKWQKSYTKISDCSMKSVSFKWFEDGELNVSVNCVDRHAIANPNKAALIWEKDEPNTQEVITYKQLSDNVNKTANLLKSLNVKKGDRVAIYMPVSPALVYAMLACTRIGAVHSVVFAGFSSGALASRIQDCGASILFTSDQAIRGGKIIEIKAISDEALRSCETVKNCIVSNRTGKDKPNCAMVPGRDVHMESENDKMSSECEPTRINAEDPLFLLYTSGSTGTPKGVLHTTAGYLLYASVTHQQVFGVEPNDKWGCVADIGWITGHTYVVYGPLCNGITSLLFESTPTYPDPSRYWEVVERLKLNHIYLSPTALRLLLAQGDEYVTKHDLSSLKSLGCVGEPLNHEAWKWYHTIVGKGRLPVIDTWWQTETGGIVIAPRPGPIDSEILPGMPMRPFFGQKPALMNPADGKRVEWDGTSEVEGNLCLTNPWPGMARSLGGNHKRFVDTYYSSFPGIYFSGDGARRTKADGYFQIAGRVDDVINTTGHRVGTAEVEDIVNEHFHVAESAIVGMPHEIKGEAIYAFVILKKEASTSPSDLATIEKEIKALVKSNIAGYAVPEHIQFSTGLPKTRSGKIMRRILRKIAANDTEDMQDTSTLADPTIVEKLIQQRRNETG